MRIFRDIIGHVLAVRCADPLLLTLVDKVLN